MKGERLRSNITKVHIIFSGLSLSANRSVRQGLELMRVNAIKHIRVTDNIYILGLVTQECHPADNTDS
jgi:hypothetical protein